MWEAYREVVEKYSRLPLDEERRLILRAQRGGKECADELVLRHIGFVIFRLRQRVFRLHLERYGEDLLSATIPVLYQKIKTYDLKYRDKNGDLRPVKFSSYIWKRIDGFVLDYLKNEDRFGCQLDDLQYNEIGQTSTVLSR